MSRASLNPLCILSFSTPNSPPPLYSFFLTPMQLLLTVFMSGSSLNPLCILSHSLDPLCILSARAIMERVQIHTDEHLILIMISLETWDFCVAFQLPCQNFISWKLPHPTFFTINFDGNVIGTHRRASFVIRSPGLGIFTAGGTFFTSQWSGWLSCGVPGPGLSMLK